MDCNKVVMTRGLFILILLLLTSHKVRGNPVICANLFLNYNQINLFSKPLRDNSGNDVTHPGSRIPPQLKDNVIRTLNRCNLMLGSSFIVSKARLDILSSDRKETAFFDPLSLRIKLTNNWAREPAILAHEYGHQIFMNNFERILPSWAEILDQLVKAEDFRYTTLQPRIDKFREAARAYTSTPPTISVADYKEIKSQRDQVEDLYIHMKPEVPQEAIDAIALSIPYQELFSDLVAVLESKNFNAISEVFQRGEDPEAAYYGEHKKIDASKILGRSFSKKSLKEKLKLTLSFSGSTSPHAFFMSVREYIGENLILKHPEEVVLENVFNAIVIEMRERLADPSIPSDRKILNRRLSEKIHQQFQN